MYKLQVLKTYFDTQEKKTFKEGDKHEVSDKDRMKLLCQSKKVCKLLSSPEKKTTKKKPSAPSNRSVSNNNKEARDIK